MNDNQKLWFALEITADSKASEAIEFAFNELDSLGTEINTLGKAKSETVCIVGYFNEKPSGETVQNQSNAALRIYGFSSAAIKKTEWRAIENKDWLAEWKKHWKATETGKFIVAPSWENVENTDKIIIRIEPNMAFGTGTHETTRLCLHAIGEIYQSDMSFLDVGTGTGILAIAAAKLKSNLAEKSLTLNSQPQNLNLLSACDIDVKSVEIAVENAELNGVDDIEFYVGSIDEDTPQFDFLCANLTADVIVPLLPLLVAKSKRMLLLSGILQQQKDWVLEELSSKFKVQISNLKIETDGEWISILIKK
jgi:ribosomal protein L11 methyltransferase